MTLECVASAIPRFFNSADGYREKKARLLKTYDAEKEMRVGDSVYCRFCRGVKLYDDPSRLFVTRCACQCEVDVWEKERSRQDRKEKISQFREAQSRLSELGRGYANAMFRNLDFSEATDSFVRAAERCERFCLKYESVRTSGRGIWLCGGSGVGKTHLAACMLHLLEQNQVTCIYTTAARILDEIRATYKSKTETERGITDALFEADVLIIDNIDAVVRRNADTWDFAVRKLSEVIEARFSNDKPIVLISNIGLAQFAGTKFFPESVLDRIASRQVEIQITGANRFKRPLQGKIEF